MSEASSGQGTKQAEDLFTELERLREAAFVGREGELQTFETFLASDHQARVFLVHGPGGVGKTTLLAAFARRGRSAGLAVAEVGGSELPQAPEAVGQVITEQAERVFAEGGLLIVDEFETLAPWEKRFREAFLTSLPAGVKVVLGGRWAPDDEWRTDPGWRSITRSLALGDFSAPETRAFLAHHEAGPLRADEVHAFTEGHPLGVALTADLLAGQPDAALKWERQPELVQGLVARHLRATQDPNCLTVLHAAAVLPRVDRPLLEATVPSTDPEADLAWLAALPFSRRGARGIRLHDMVSEALRIEMKRLEPDRHTAFLRRASKALSHRLASEGSEAAVADFVRLLRDIPLIRQTLPTAQGTGHYIGAARATDLPVLADLVEHFEGEEARAWFSYWAERQPEGIAVLRGPDQTPAGMSFFIAPFEEEDPTGQGDPGVAAFRNYLAEHAPLRHGERGHLCRFMLTADSRQGSSPTTTQLRAYNAFYAIRVPNLAFSASVVPVELGLNHLYRLINFPVLEGTEFQLGGQGYCLMGHDWRLEPSSEWAVNTTERLLSGQSDPELGKRPGAVLSRTAFGEAVKAALKGLLATNGLADNPLLDCPLVVRAPPEENPSDPEATLAVRITQAIEHLEGRHDSAELGRVLRATYLRGAPKQRAAANIVGMSYGTYRRRLQEATSQLTDLLWEWDREATVGSFTED